MKPTSTTDLALREALARKAKQQPAPPADLTERFMNRWQTSVPEPQQAAEAPTAGHLHRQRKPPRIIVSLLATAAAVVLAMVLWPKHTEKSITAEQPLIAEAVPAVAEVSAPEVTVAPPQVQEETKTTIAKATRRGTSETISQKASAVSHSSQTATPTNEPIVTHTPPASQTPQPITPTPVTDSHDKLNVAAQPTPQVASTTSVQRRTAYRVLQGIHNNRTALIVSEQVAATLVKAKNSIPNTTIQYPRKPQPTTI